VAFRSRLREVDVEILRFAQDDNALLAAIIATDRLRKAVTTRALVGGGGADIGSGQVGVEKAVEQMLTCFAADTETAGDVGT